MAPIKKLNKDNTSFDKVCLHLEKKCMICGNLLISSQDEGSWITKSFDEGPVKRAFSRSSSLGDPFKPSYYGRYVWEKEKDEDDEEEEYKKQNKEDEIKSKVNRIKYKKEKNVEEEEESGEIDDDVDSDDSFTLFSHTSEDLREWRQVIKYSINGMPVGQTRSSINEENVRGIHIGHLDDDHKRWLNLAEDGVFNEEGPYITADNESEYSDKISNDLLQMKTPPSSPKNEKPDLLSGCEIVDSISDPDKIKSLESNEPEPELEPELESEPEPEPEPELEPEPEPEPDKFNEKYSKKENEFASPIYY